MKQLEKTDAVLAQLRRAYGSDANLGDLAVYEVVLANTLPLRKAGGLFQGARLSSSLLPEIVAAVNLESVPLQLQHDTGPLPVGRVFAAKMTGDEARGLIAVDAKAYPQIVQSLDSGTVDQVSVGMLNDQLLCSKCDFNYMADNALENRWSLTCNQDHKIGEDGTHVRVTGLKSLFETSLVGRGAVNGARVVSPRESTFADRPALAAAAASGRPFLHLTCTPVEPEMAIDAEVLTRLEASATERAELTVKLTGATAQVTELTTQLTAANTARDTAVARTAELETQLAAAPKKEDVDAAVATLSGMATRVLIATGASEADAAAAIKDKSATELGALIDEKSAQLSAVIPAGGRAKSADSEGAPALRASSAFVTPK